MTSQPDLRTRRNRVNGTDLFLGLILIGVLVLVVAAVILVMRRTPPSYKEESTAENVAYDYLLAMQWRDYDRAFSYLSPSLRGYPGSADRFYENVHANLYAFNLSDNSTDLEIVSSRSVRHDPEVEQVSVRETRYSTGWLFGRTEYTTTFQMELERESSGWKIRLSDRYFLSCWTQSRGCD